MISIFIKILVYDSEMGKDFVNRFFLGELNKVDYYYNKLLLLLLLLLLDLLGLNINWDIVLFSAPVAYVTFLFFSFSYF